MKAPDKPDVRLAYHPEGNRTLDVRLAWPVNAYGALTPTVRLVANGHKAKAQALGAPTVRLALCDSPPERGESPTLRLAHHHNAQGDNNLKGRHGVKPLPVASAPALLVSFVYLKPFIKNRKNYVYRDWALDSGAYSAHNSGTEIDLQEYINTCLELIETDPTLIEIFALDVIGDDEVSLRNTEEMWRQGVKAIPTFHVGEPEAYLLHIAKEYPKIALGGAVGFKGKDAWAQQCFARVWPKAIHGFGFGGRKSIMLLPWHSVDATNWEAGPCKFGRWNSFGNMSVRGSQQNLRAEVEYFLKLEKEARQRWKKEFEKLPNGAGSIRLANVQSGRERAKRSALKAYENHSDL